MFSEGIAYGWPTMVCPDAYTCKYVYARVIFPNRAWKINAKARIRRFESGLNSDRISATSDPYAYGLGSIFTRFLFVFAFRLLTDRHARTVPPDIRTLQKTNSRLVSRDISSLVGSQTRGPVLRGGVTARTRVVKQQAPCRPGRARFSDRFPGPTAMPTFRVL